MQHGRNKTGNCRDKSPRTADDPEENTGIKPHIEEGSVVSILPIGDSLIITPKRLELDEARRQLRKLIKASGLTIEDLIKGLQEERTELFAETYGAKKKM